MLGIRQFHFGVLSNYGVVMSNLIFEPKPAGLLIRSGGDVPVPVRKWTLDDEASGAGTLMRLRDDGQAIETDDGDALLLLWRWVAGLTISELRYIGLPDAMPFALEIVSDGSINDVDFRIHCGYIGKGRRILGVIREGAWLRVGEKDYVLLDPLYGIVEAIDEFNQASGTALESRMLRWGQIAEMLPDDAVVNDQHLRSLNIVVASSFEISPFVNSQGEPDFDPVIGRRETRTNAGGDEEQAFCSALPLARQEQFARKFRQLSRVKHRYAVGGNSYVVLTPEVECALGAVRRAQAGTAAERRDFLRHISGYLHNALESADEELEVDLDRVFSDEGLSERVKGIGAWVDKVLPWIIRAPDPWLPPESLGLRIGTQNVTLASDDLPALRDKIRAAIEAGETAVDLTGDISIPATPATLEAVDELIRNSQPTQYPKPKEKLRQEDTPDTAPQVLLILDNLDAVRFDRERRNRQPNIAEAAPILRTSLLPHQSSGLEWLLQHWNAGSWGALLADDMGLGKTLTALAFLSCLQTHVRTNGLEHQPMLIVAPTGLLRNWLDEHSKHMVGDGIGRPLEAHGVTLRRIKTSNSNQGGNELTLGQPLLDTAFLNSTNWVLTTYETLRDYQHSFVRVRWRAAVFDEAQKIKNPGIRLTEAALAMDIDFTLLMTGTPVENRPSDIWSMLDRAEPGRFGTLKDFSERYESGNGAGSKLDELHDALTTSGGMEAPSLMLRRLKEDHIPRLPEKIMHRRVVEMPPFQADEYERVVSDRRKKRSMLEMLHRLRSISLHPLVPHDFGNDQYIRQSARLSETFRILRDIAHKREKALLFVESRQIQDFLVVELRRRFRLLDDVLVINGMVAGHTRKSRVDMFQCRTGFDVMILSPRAGGVGLTLTAANHVIHLSRWWNPAVEDQCTDRVFRIGQDRTVHVYLPLAKHPRFGEYSFDLKLDGLMERKREMNRQVLAPTVATGADVSDLYHSTMNVPVQSAGLDMSESGLNVDLLEPFAFESWVLRELAVAGYDTRQTPRSGDRGADGLAYSRTGDKSHTIVVQCKHLQPDAKCGVNAVQEVVASLPNYDVAGEARPMVVSNAAGFTDAARRLAKDAGVWLVDRSRLSSLRSWHYSCG